MAMSSSGNKTLRKPAPDSSQNNAAARHTSVGAGFQEVDGRMTMGTTNHGKCAFTPGPWEVHEATHACGEFWCSIGYNGGGPITDIVGAEGNHSKYFIPVAGMKYLVTPVEQQKANARLIALAPDMAEFIAGGRCQYKAPEAAGEVCGHCFVCKIKKLVAGE